MSDDELISGDLQVRFQVGGTTMRPTLNELWQRYAWVQTALQVKLGDGKLDSEQVRFLIQERQPFMYDEAGELVLNEDGEPRIDLDADPFYYGLVQAYSYMGDPLSRTVAGQIEVALQLLDHAPAALDALCDDLNHEYAAALRADGSTLR